MTANYEPLLPWHCRADSVSEEVCTLQFWGSRLAFSCDVCEVVPYQGDSVNFTDSHSWVISRQRSETFLRLYPNVDFRDVARFLKRKHNIFKCILTFFVLFPGTVWFDCFVWIVIKHSYYQDNVFLPNIFFIFCTIIFVFSINNIQLLQTLWL